jgi:HAD superfamily hydrolase (TIGR01509 family)
VPAETPAHPPVELNTRRFSAAVFDFDETIIDLEPQHTAAHAALCREQGSDYAAMPKSFRLGSGRRIIDDIRDMRAHFDWRASEEELFTRRQELFDAVCRDADLTPMEGVRELIARLRERGLTLAIASSAVGASLVAILARLKLRDAFRLIVDGSEVAHGKPDPEAYLVTARKLGVAPADCVVFEDSHVGVVAAKRAGIFCVAVRNPRAQVRQDLSMADAIVDSMRDITVAAS